MDRCQDSRLSSCRAKVRELSSWWEATNPLSHDSWTNCRAPISEIWSSRCQLSRPDTLRFLRADGGPPIRSFDGLELACQDREVADFSGIHVFTTWDGEPVSRERPHGATVVVASRAPQGWRYLLLHRAHHGGPSREGDWAWTPPTGSRKPGEDLISCVTRELREEVGWDAS
jgi:hypothetical protein